MKGNSTGGAYGWGGGKAPLTPLSTPDDFCADRYGAGGDLYSPSPEGGDGGLDTQRRALSMRWRFFAALPPGGRPSFFHHPGDGTGGHYDGDGG